MFNDWPVANGPYRPLGLLLLAGLVGHFLVYRVLHSLIRKTNSDIDDLFVKHCYRSVQWLVLFMVVRLFLPQIVPGGAVETGRHLIGIVFIVLVSLLVVKGMYVLEEYVFRKYSIDEKDNLKARKIHTQFDVLKRIVVAVTCFLALGLILMTFDRVRQLGTTILASAGIVGIVIGMAAQRTIGTFIAGIQIAFTQPIRLDDVVIVENEWGRIEEITLTYVVVRIWDLRRLIVPITYFLERPFQNWTRTSADLLGTVFVYADYTVPVERVREKLQEILNESEHWDGKVCVLQVTNATDRTVELRALMSAADASIAWTLRCEVREKLLAFLRGEFPESLPKARVELEKAEAVEGAVRPSGP